MAANDNSLSLPLILGVTGHRDLRPADSAPLEEQVRLILTELRADHPEAPLLLLSPLAEGADRLVARVALEGGVRVVVPLPLPRAEYEKDFATPESKAEFARLLGRAESWFELPLAQGNTPDNILADGPARHRHYEAAGLYIARHCHLLLALWDGVDSKKVGGTSEIVRLRLRGLPPSTPRSRSELGPLDTGSVYHVLTPRLKNPSPAGVPFTRRALFPTCGPCEPIVESELVRGEPAAVSFEREERLDGSFTESWRQINQFNRDLRELGPELAGRMRQGEQHLMPDDKAAQLDEGMQLLRRRYAAADALALHFQARRRGSWKALCALGVGGIALLSSSENLAEAGSSKVVLLGLYLAVVGAAFLVLRLAEDRKLSGVLGYRSRHLDYRALAEGLRVQFFWRLGGQREDVADHYLRKQRSELEWIGQAIRAWNVPPSAPPRQFALVREHWIETQKAYFREAQRRNRAQLHRLHAWAGRFFFCALVLVVLLLLLHLTPLVDGHAWKLVGHLGGVLVVVALAAFGAIEVYADKMALLEEAKQYDLMARLFSRAGQRLGRAVADDDETRIDMILFELGRDALTENGDWVLLHRERPMEVRVG